jgi:hypothetical protein
LFDWNGVAEAFNYSVQQHGEQGILVQDGPIPSHVILFGECIPVVAEIQKLIHEKRRLTDKDRVNCHIFYTMSPTQFTIGEHSDIHDVYIWQVKGRTRWWVDGMHEEFQLGLNQMIYIPANTLHKPTVDIPRISVSFSIEHGAYE